MDYLFREVGFEGKMIRFIKPLNFDSDGFLMSPVNELNEVAKEIERQEPTTIVVIMGGLGSTIVAKSQTKRADFMKRFWQSYQRMPDYCYEWDSATS
jgi:hypothetical protein